MHYFFLGGEGGGLPRGGEGGGLPRGGEGGGLPRGGGENSTAAILTTTLATI